ncbi:hypothetical protein [Nocardia terpenica]|uniref:DUF8176 domain-containing protein n=1 Tax=Nocardia terpenica TaxID=455432 RepID=A0A291RY86_9NOCA|nr:hypothetical protein [Nocardia terpenica]ATL72541.1 hypothetical protein CRH09_39925 [Nocardia terpenica]
MLFPNNGSDDGNAVSGPTAGWGDWLRPEPADPAAGPVPAAEVMQAAPRNGAEVAAAATDSAWSQWLEDSGPAEQDTAATAAAAPAQRRRPLVFALGGAVLAVGAVIAGAVALMSTTRTPVPALPTPAVTPPSASATDPVLGGGPGCDATRAPNLVRGNGTGGTASGPDAILAFQHGYYAARSGAAAWSVVAPGAQVSPVEAIDAGIATVPAGTRYCVTITPAADSEYLVVITETRPDTSVRTWQQRVTVAAQGGKTLITRIGRVE